MFIIVHSISISNNIVEFYKHYNNAVLNKQTQELQILILITYYHTHEPSFNAIGNMLTLDFFFLLWPGEYAYTDNEKQLLFAFVMYIYCATTSILMPTPALSYNSRMQHTLPLNL
jgi:hypothetical protein